MQPVDPALQAREKRLPGPEGREQWRDWRLEGREEGGDVGERLHVEQALGAQEPQQHDDRDREQEAHEHQNVARAPGREDVDQQERDHGAQGAGDEDEREDGQRRRQVEAGGGAAGEADGEQHRQEERGHHPARLARRPREP
jgi:hypothetical protein